MAKDEMINENVVLRMSGMSISVIKPFIVRRREINLIKIDCDLPDNVCEIIALRVLKTFEKKKNKG